jgi:hypothetical protein
MKLRIALFLSAAFLAAALALALLPACSDGPGAYDCSINCGDCFLIRQGGGDSGSYGDCVCIDKVDHDDDPETPDICPV